MAIVQFYVCVFGCSSNLDIYLSLFYVNSSKKYQLLQLIHECVKSQLTHIANICYC